MGCHFLRQADRAPVDLWAISSVHPQTSAKPQARLGALGSDPVYIAEASHRGSMGLPCRSVAQAIRASLLARATTATLRCARARRSRSHAPRGVCALASQGRAARAPWISNVRRYVFPRFVMPRSFGLPPVVCCRGTSPSQAARSRPRRKAAPLPTAATSAVALRTPIPGIVIRTRRCVRAGSLQDLPGQGRDAPVECRPLVLHLVDELTHAPADLIRRSHDLGQGLIEGARPFWDDVAPLEEDRTELVRERRPGPDEARAHPVQGLKVKLPLRLELDEAHGGPARGFGNRLGIAVVVLLRLHVGPHILRRHQADAVALSGEQAPEMMSAAAGLHSNDARRQRGREGHEGVAANAPAQYDFAGPVQSNDAVAVLARSIPRTAICMGSLLSSTRQASLRRPPRRGRPFHKSR